MHRPTPIGTRHETFALAHEGMRQGDIAARVGVTRKKTLIASSWGKLSLPVWNQGRQQELLERPQPTDNAHSSEWSVKTASIVPMPSLKG